MRPASKYQLCFSCAKPHSCPVGRPVPPARLSTPIGHPWASRWRAGHLVSHGPTAVTQPTWLGAISIPLMAQTSTKHLSKFDRCNLSHFKEDTGEPSKASRCEQLAHSRVVTQLHPDWESNSRPHGLKSDALPLRHHATLV